MPPTAIAVIGGGITGLTSAFHLSRRFPNASITVFEATNRVGGWIRSRRVQVKDVATGAEADVVLEEGPRTLRPKSNALLELINLLDLQHSLITTPKSSPAVRHRFLHIPGRPGLTRIFSSSFPLLLTPYISSILVPAVVHDALRLPNRTRNREDESLSSFLVRHFGSKFERIFGSSLIHGIYAADARILSTHAAFPILVEAEELGGGSVFRGMLVGKRKKDIAGYDLGSIPDLLEDASVFSFLDGLEIVTRALTSYLNSTRTVYIRTSTRVSALRRTASGSFEIGTSNGEYREFSHIASTVSLPMLDTILPPYLPDSLPHLKANPSSSVTVINIIFPPCKHPIHPPGFGYLIPRPEQGYEATDSGFLGVVFDSCALSTQDHVPGLPENVSGFTKLTVMLGGPYNLTPAHKRIDNVFVQLQNHLSPMKWTSGGGVRLPWPVYFEAHEHKDCIPIPTVGHTRRMDELRFVLKQEPWKGKLEVVGAGVGGVSVPDCIAAGREVGKDW